MIAGNLIGRYFIVLLIPLLAGCYNPDSVIQTEESASMISTEVSDSLSLIFVGDIMCFGSQTRSAYNSESGAYDFESVFRKIKPILKGSDFSIGNLELTFAGEPYTGYPQFSAPDHLATALYNSGINVVSTANNHSCDKGLDGIVKTINILDSIGIAHTGSFIDRTDWRRNNLLVLNKNNFRLGILSYTFGTNGLRVPEPAIVNMIDTLLMLSDIKRSKRFNLDKTIVMLHWGNEYKSDPNDKQVKIVDFLIRNDVDIIIGTHPHVLCRMEYYPDSLNKDRLIAYSLGNFLSNQRFRKTDGGAVLKINLVKGGDMTRITDVGYYLTWVNKPVLKTGVKFEIIKCTDYESGVEPVSKLYQNRIKTFIGDSRSLLDENNVGVSEIKN